MIVRSYSRLVPKKERDTILQELLRGEVDILIATHAVITEKVRFKNLGLLIIDEEHRFGVRHKEYFRKMRENVEVLSLSATPIPRTLYMALAGIKQMSIIDTPPPDRKAVKTYIVEYSESLVKEAIEREIERGGQVFFIHNRAREIDFYVRKIRSLVPEVRVIGAHGQLRPRELENRIIAFVSGSADVLVSTNIVEAGLDMPRVNTIIINNAHSFGLADLYQLRGRVGRSPVQAYAYLLLPPGFTVSEEAKKRLLAMKRFVEPGSGYRMALEDLEIRGAGTLLGKHQSGKMEEVGIDFYLEALRHAVLQKRGRPEEPAGHMCCVRVLAEARIPRWYIAEEEVRLKVYRRLSRIESEEDVDEIFQEVRDIFGPPPSEVEFLFQVMKFKLRMTLLGAENVEEQQPGHFKVSLREGWIFVKKDIDMKGVVVDIKMRGVP